jgi:glycosyltransferase involved in cell wall biosynthesis
MSRRIKIAYCVSYLWNSGGVDRVITVKANYLAEVLNYDITIITTDQQGVKPYFPLSNKVKTIDLDINFYQYHGTSYSGWRDIIVRLYRSTVKRALYRYRLSRTLKQLNPDITISVSRRELPFLYKIRAGGVKICERHMCHSNRLHHPASKINRLIARFLTNKESCWVTRYSLSVVLTEEDKSLWPDYRHMRVIPNPLTIHPTRISSLSNKQVLAVGRICAEKGFERLVDSWRLIEPQYADWTLKIVGSQDDKKQTDLLKQRIECYGLKRVELIPETQDIAEVYADSSLLVLTSYYEGLPLVLIEANACGVPCVAMACQCGPRDMIKDGWNGLLVPDGDIPAMAEAMKKVMSDDALRKRMGKNALMESYSYSLPVIMSRWDKLFKELAAK